MRLVCLKAEFQKEKENHNLKHDFGMKLISSR